jgi:hypothetical protein
MKLLELNDLIDSIITKQLSESPDKVMVSKVPRLKYDLADAYGFGYLDGKLSILPAGHFHGKGNYKYTRDNLKSAGRFWYKEKVLSFWTIDKNINTIIKDLNAEIKVSQNTIDIKNVKIDGNWNVDVASYVLLGKYSTWEKVGVVKPLSQVMSEAPKGDCDDYTASWNTAIAYIGKVNSDYIQIG